VDVSTFAEVKIAEEAPFQN